MSRVFTGRKWVSTSRHLYSTKDSNRQIKATIRQRKAAHKAWKTIRQNNRLAAGRGSKTILEFVKPDTVTTL